MIRRHGQQKLDRGAVIGESDDEVAIQFAYDPLITRIPRPHAREIEIRIWIIPMRMRLDRFPIHHFSVN